MLSRRTINSTTEIPRTYANISSAYLLKPLRISLSARKKGTEICFLLLRNSPGMLVNLSPLFSPWIASITLILFILLKEKKLNKTMSNTVTVPASPPITMRVPRSGNI